MSKQYFDLVVSAAENAVFKWPGIAEVDDVEQGIWERILETEGLFEGLSELDPDEIVTCLNSLGNEVVKREAIAYENYSGNWSYDTKTVKRILERGCLQNTRDRINAESLDIRESLKHLREIDYVDYEHIVNVYLYNNTRTRDILGLNYAIDNLTRIMNTKQSAILAERVAA